MADAEAQLKKVRRLEANRSCPNCGTPAPTGLGFGNICVKYQTFVCNDCKSSHQAISHRCKSVSMSTWTIDEVLDLTTPRGGGNEVALRTWLANAPPIGGRYDGGYRPKTGDKIEVFKQFIVDCYEKRMFYGNIQSAPTSPVTHSAPVAVVSPKPPHRVASAPPQMTQTPQPAVNFFDDAPSAAFPSSSSASFNGFDAFGPSTASPSSAGVFDAFETSSASSSGFAFMNPPTPPQTTSSHDFGFDFNAFPAAPSSSAPAPALISSKTVPALDFDPFAAAPNHPTRATSNGFDFATASATHGAKTSASFDAFGPSSGGILSFQTATPSAPLSTGAGSAMNNNNRAAMAISSLGMTGPPRGGMGGMGMGMYPGQQPRGPPPSNSFDFVGSAMQSELGRGTGSAMRSPTNRGMSNGFGGGGMGLGMSGSGMNGGGMGMGMGGAMGMGMGGGGMNGAGNSSFNIGSMGNLSQPPRGPSNSYPSGGGFPSAW
jgi:hypothetical protein